MFGLTIAGLDPSGGAGVLADIKTFSALEIYGTSAVTALTAQNPKKFFSFEIADSNFLEEQIDSILSFYDIEYAKTGMLYSEEIIDVVSKKAIEYDLKLIIDPVMITGSGATIANDSFSKKIKEKLLKQAILVTPNIHEAEEISDMSIDSEEDAIESAIKIGKHTNVLITGGHFQGKSIFFDDRIHLFENELIDSKNTHGTGCTLSAAITSYLIKGYSLKKSIIKSEDYVKKGVLHGMKGSLNHFHNFYKYK